MNLRNANLESMALKWDGECLWVLDQTQLPDEEIWLDGSEPRTMAGLIHRLSVRGAPLIGVAAALSYAWALGSNAGDAALEADWRFLREARPTAVNLAWAMDRMKQVQEYRGREAARDEALAIFHEDVALCEAMSAHGLTLFDGSEAVLTHCNSGGLATVGVGTALGLIRRAWEAGKVSHVFVDETRPLLQGGRLTAWELGRLGIPHTLITDSMAAILMREGRIQRVLLGADRIAMNGDFANKVGTYGVAVQAHFHGVPFHTVAPWSTVDTHCPSGKDIPIEHRDAKEVRGFGSLRWAPVQSEAFNPSFDVTPVSLLTSIVLDRGVFTREQLEAGALQGCCVA
jgi:methylthioribose-1-phosphate isomerase